MTENRTNIIVAAQTTSPAAIIKCLPFTEGIQLKGSCFISF